MKNSRFVSRALFLFTLFCFISGGPATLFADTDVTSLVSLDKGLLRYDRRTKTSYFDATVTNISGASVTTPIRVVIAAITPSQVTLANPDGYTTTGRPYFEYTAASGQLLPGESSPAKRWVLNNPGQLRFSFTLEQVVSLGNEVPTADAGDDAEFTLAAGQTQISVILDGSGSSDPDGAIAAYRWSGSPDPADVANPTVSLSPGTHTFTLVVTDNEDEESAPDMVTITVHEPPNRTPVAHAGQDVIYRLTSGQSVVNATLNGSGSSDQDGEIVSYAWSGSPDPQDIMQPTITLSEGNYTFTLIVTDDDGVQSDPDSVVITILPATPTEEHPPVVSVSPLSHTISEGQTLTVAVTGSDPDGQVVTLSAQPKIAGSTFAMTSGTLASGTFTFTPTASQQGIHVVSFKARDTKGLSDTKNVQIRVTNVNQPPVISVPSAVAVDEGDIITIPIQAGDPDGDTLTLTTDTLPANAVFIPATASITFTPDFDQAGDYEIVCRATDGAFTVQDSVIVSVYDVPTGGPGQARELVLEVDPVESPTFLGSTHITGVVNPTGDEPQPSRMTSALITSMSPATAAQGQTLEVELVSDTSQQYTAHFVQGVSQASFGDGITVRGITVLSPTQARVSLSVSPNAALGPHTVRVTTGAQTALGVVAFHVTRGQAGITGVLVDQGTGAPIAGAVVTIQGTDITTVTNADGSFSFGNVPAGSYNLIINAQDHDLIYQEVSPTTGSLTNVGQLESVATVYAPGTAPAQSIQSVLLRGIADTTGHTNREDLKQAIRDTILLIAGNEVGLLDEYGNQLNPNARDGTGYYSLTEDGVRNMADRMMRGESIALIDLLFFVNFCFTRTQGSPQTLDAIMADLQAAVDAAWTDPTGPDSVYAQVMFGRGRSLSPDTPRLSPHTRLTPLQAHVFVSSFLTYLFTRDDPGWGSPSRFWRNNNTIARVDQLNVAINGGFLELTAFFTRLSIMPTMMNLAQQGLFMNDLGTHMFNALSLDSMVPREPVLTSIAVENSVVGWNRVAVSFARSASDLGGSPWILYSLWRFDAANDTRTLVNTINASQLGYDARTAVIEDPCPPAGTYFYAMTVTRLASPMGMVSEQQLQDAVPFWQSNTYDVADAWSSFRAANLLVSDYSNALVATVGEPGSSGIPSGLEVDAAGSVYYLTGDRKAINRVTLEGLGVLSTFARIPFKEPYAQGLAMDSFEDIYTENAASDSSFGGRIFRFPKSGATQEFTGSLNYFSQMLMFAQPTSAGPMAFGPDNRLYVVDNLSRQVKQVDVNATYDPYRRVGQPYAAIPGDAGVQAYDMEVDSMGNVYLLYAGQTTPPYIVPGQPLRLVRTEAPGGMVLDRAGNIYYTDRGDGTFIGGRLMMFPLGATRPITILSGLNKPGDIELIPGERGLIISEDGDRISRKYFGLSVSFRDSANQPVTGLTLYVTRSFMGTTGGYRAILDDVYSVPELLVPAFTDNQAELTVQDVEGRTHHFTIEMGQDGHSEVFGQTVKSFIISD